MKRSPVRMGICLILGALLVLLLPGLYNGLRIVRVPLEIGGLTAPVRIALIADLHSCDYGPGQQPLIDAVAAEAPDVILLGGDIFDDVRPEDCAIDFLRGIHAMAPCFYVTGNHEYWAGAQRFADNMACLEALGITRLSGTSAALTMHGRRFEICGLDDPCQWGAYDSGHGTLIPGFAAQLEQAAAELSPGTYRILLTHRPEYADLYRRQNFDLVLAGHAHGGQWRIPGLLNGLYAPNQGLFPRYAGEKYDLGGTTMIVSRGLARASTWIPRIWNRPELVVLELR